jgi:hypothetical protein
MIPQVIGLLVGGFGALIIFALYEHFGNPKQPLTPTHSKLIFHNLKITYLLIFL